MHAALLLAVALTRWSTNGPTDGPTGSLAQGPGPNPRLYTLSYSSTQGGGVYRSDDGGTSWQRMSSTIGFITLAVDPHDPDRVFAADVHGGFSGFSSRVYRSVDGGATWTQLLQRFQTTGCRIALDPIFPGTVYVSYEDIPAFFRSDDGGDTFMELAAPFLGAHLATAADGTLIAVTGSVYFSRDRGQSWANAAPPLPCAVHVATHRSDPLRWYVSSGTDSVDCRGVASTGDGGVSWTLAADPGGRVNGIAADGSDPGLVYVSVGLPAPFDAPGRVLASMDGGVTWIDLGSPGGGGRSGLAVTDDGRHVWAATGDGVYRRDLHRPRTLRR